MAEPAGAASGVLERIIDRNVADALEEDVGDGDLSARLVDADALVGAKILARESLVLAGQPWAEAVFRRLDARIHVDWYIRDGETADAGDVVCKLVGPPGALLTGERTALNFLQTFSGTATVTARYVAAVEGTGVRILDTRKTLPGLRHAQKYAVRCGGGCNHRMGLFDAVLIKENHIRTAGGISRAMQRARAETREGILIEIEVENEAELGEALAAGARRILLDNFCIEAMRQAVALTAGRAELEASGNVTLDTVRTIAETGVDYISVGALTKHVRAADLSMLFRID